MLAVVWEYRARFFKIDVALYRNLIVAFIPAAVLGLLFSKYIKSLSVPRRAGGARVHRRRRDHSSGRTKKSFSHGWKTAQIDDLARRAEGRLRAVLRADPRHLALGRDHHRRHAVRPVAPGGDRVLVLPRGADADRGGRLRPVEEPRAVLRGRPRRCSASARSSRSSRRSS